MAVETNPAHRYELGAKKKRIVESIAFVLFASIAYFLFHHAR